jgi:formylglycine-generating enzyme required for sulfatase activity
VSLALGAIVAAPAYAAFPADPVTKCAPDAVLAGSVCIDKYEASVWRIPALNPGGRSNKGLITKVRKGKAKAKVADLSAGGATPLGVAGDDYAPCTDNGQNCANDIYAVSLVAVTPAAYITWFQAQEACTNAGKRLPSNAEWQAAANGSPDPGPDNGTTDCNTASAFAAVATGSRSSCVSARGAFDMVGNLDEWVADWVPLSTARPGWGSFSNDYMCLSGASTTVTGPGALIRGGSFVNGTSAGPLTVNGNNQPSNSNNNIGFRCGR